MKIAASAFALVLATGAAAYAQGTPTPAAPSANPSTTNQCWDMATNSVKNTQGATLSQGASTGATGGASTTTGGMTPPASAKAPVPGSSTTGAATARPAGIPNC